MILEVSILLIRLLAWLKILFHHTIHSNDAPEAVTRCEDVAVRKQRSSTLVLVTTTIPDLKKVSFSLNLFTGSSMLCQSVEN